MKPVRLSLLAATLLCGSAQAGPSLIVNSGILTGANGVVVEGVSYDVAFQEGTCAQVFAGCDDASDFAFSSETSATAAAQALLDGVFVNGLLGAFDNRSFDTIGCDLKVVIFGPPGQSGIVGTIYESLGCNAFTPYGLSLLNSRSRVVVASNLSLNDLGLDDAVVSEAPLLSSDTGELSFSDFGQVWAVWTPSAMVVDPPPVDPPPVDPPPVGPPGTVPEPSSLLLAGAALLLLHRHRLTAAS